MSLENFVEDGRGQIVELTVQEDSTALDISGFTTAKAIVFRGPDGKLVTKTASFTNTGTDGKIRCTLGTSDIDTDGTWQVQAHITSTTQDIYSKPVSFLVEKRLT